MGVHGAETLARETDTLLERGIGEGLFGHTRHLAGPLCTVLAAPENDPTESQPIMMPFSHGTAVWLVSAAMLLPAVARAETQSRVEHALARVRAAIGWEVVEQHPGVVRIEGAARLLGTDGRHTQVFDRRGRWLQSIHGPLPSLQGFDGETAWAIDWNRTHRVLELGDRHMALLLAAFSSGAWTAPAGELVFDALRELSDGVALDFHLAGGHMAGVVRLDASTYLPRDVSWKEGSRPVVMSFAQFTDHGGLRLPDRLTVSISGSEESIETHSVVFEEAPDDGYFAPRSSPRGDTRFSTDVSPELKVRRTATNHILVRPTVDGQDLGWFLFDTGAGINCISTHVAGRLAEGPIGQLASHGVGGPVMSQLWRADELRLGPVTVADQHFLELDLAFLDRPFGVAVAGIIGWDLLARCVVEFDQTTPSIALFDPAVYDLADTGHWEELILYQRHPAVKAQFEGSEGIFKIDTGAARDTVAMHFETVRDQALLEGRKTRPGSAQGVGGQVAMSVGEVESFVLGGREFTDFEAEFALEDKGAFSDDYSWGNIGGQLLKPFVMVFDYQGRRLGFVPRADP